MGLGTTPLKPVGTEDVVGHTAGEDVKGGHEDGVLDRLASLGVADAAPEASELGTEVGVLGPPGGLGGLGQIGGQPLRALAGLA
jgi:hypothetical protein